MPILGPRLASDERSKISLCVNSFYVYRVGSQASERHSQRICTRALFASVTDLLGERGRVFCFSVPLTTCCCKQVIILALEVNA